MGIYVLNKRKVKTAIITSRKNNITINRAKKLKVDFIHQGLEGKGKLKLLNLCRK